MNKQPYNPDARFQGVKETCRTTGLSQYYLRQRIKANELPCIKSGKSYYIDVPALLAQLEEERKAGKW